MKRVRRTIFLICAIIYSCSAFAQDPHFTQFYSLPFYLNPAFAGANVCARFSSVYRDQWPSIPKSYVTYVTSFDQALPRYNSGIGVFFISDKQGAGVLKTIGGSAIYSYEAQLNRKWAARAGLEGSFKLRTIDYSNQVFADQMTRGGGLPTVETLPGGSNLYYDFATGIVVYSLRHWYGFSAHHITRPNVTLIDGNSRIPVKYSLHGGYKIPVGISKKKKHGKIDEYILPAFNYKKQGKYDQLDIGMYYGRYILLFGAWYRGIPVQRTVVSNAINHDAFALLFGISVSRLNIGYSYDITISRLGVLTSGGAHEVSLSYQFCDYKRLKNKKRKPRLLLPCPKF